MRGKVCGGVGFDRQVVTTLHCLALGKEADVSRRGVSPLHWLREGRGSCPSPLSPITDHRVVCYGATSFSVGRGREGVGGEGEVVGGLVCFSLRGAFDVEIRWVCCAHVEEN